MTSRERVLASFAHEEGDRVPIWCGLSDEFRRKACKQLSLDEEGLLQRLGDDFRRVHARYSGPPVKLQCPDAKMRTPFGVERAGLGYGQPISHPLHDATLAQVHEYPWPDPNWVDVSHLRAEAQVWGRRYAILGGDWSPFWHDAIEMLGMETFYFKMHDEPELIDALLGHIVEYYFQSSRRIFDAAADVIDIFFMGNDYGSQTGPLMSPDMFKRFLLPHQKRLIDLGHDYGLKTQMHCCGGVEPLIPLFIDAGLDALHAVQTTCHGMDLAHLKSHYGGRIVFNGGIDSHHVLIDGTTDCVRAKTREVLAIMMPGGGYVAGATHDSVLEETPVENIVAMCDTIRDDGVYA